MLVPLTLPSYLHLAPRQNSQTNATEQSFIDEPCSKIIAWRAVQPSGSLGAAVGTKFGSVYLFGTPPPGEPTSKTSPPSLSRTRFPTPITLAPSGARPSSPPSSPKSPPHSRRHSGSPSTLSLNQALIKPSARSRVVSGVSHEQVQASKSFVDFEDESERLKDLLRSSAANRQPRERSIVDALLPTFEKGVVIERTPLPPSPFLPPSTLSPASPGSSKGRDDPKSLLSATNSPIFTPRSLSAPPSPHFPTPSDKTDEESIALIAHVLPPRCGVAHAVADLIIPEGTDLLVSLQESGDVSVFDTHDGTCIATAQCRKAPQSQKDTSCWTRLRSIQIEEKGNLILACATYRLPYSELFGLPDSPDEIASKYAHYALFELHVGDPFNIHPTWLESLGNWQVDGFAEGSDMVRNDVDGSLSFIYVNSAYHVISRPLSVVARFEVRARARSAASSTANSAEELWALTIPNPLKSLGTKSTENIASRDVEGTMSEGLAPPNTDLSRLWFGPDQDVGEAVFSSSPRRLRGLCSRYVVARDAVVGLVWTDTEVLIFQFQLDGKALDQSLTHIQPEGVGKILEVQFVDSETFAVLGSIARWYKLIPMDANGDQSDSENARLQPMPAQTISLGTPSAASLINTANGVVTLRHTSAGHKEVSLFTPLEVQDRTYHRLWRSQLATASRQEMGTTLTTVLPLEFNSLIFGYSDGHLRHTSFSALTSQKFLSESPPSSSIPPIEVPLFQNTSNTPIPASIHSLHLIRNERTGDRFIIGGSDDGGITVWSLQDLKLCASFVQFIAPLLYVLQVRQQEEHAGPLRGCALCVSVDGTIAVMAVDGFELLYVLPGASSPLSSIHYGGGEEHDLLMVLYVGGSARLWDIKTGEFRRAMDTDKARDALSASGWFELPIDGRDTRVSRTVSTLANDSATVDSMCTFTIALERFMKLTAVDAKASGNVLVSSVTHSSALTHLRTLLSIVLTPGLSPDIDEVCELKLGIAFSSGGVGHVSLCVEEPRSSGATTLYNYQNVKNAWCVSGAVSASRAIAIITILKTMSLYEDISDDCQTVMTFYATSLQSVVGSHFKAPDVVYLARQWLDASNELRHAARILFDSGVVKFSDEESCALVDAWQHHLPCLQPSADQDSKQSGLALFLCGYMAIEKYSLLSTSALVDISKSISLYLHDDTSSHRALAIDLCAKGFHIWQHYVDSMAMLRALFALATNMRKEQISVQNVGPHARSAVLQTAMQHTALFMTVLTLDILKPRSVAERKSVMQLVAFLIRKRPLILYPHLPRLMEAVVKSLDPNSTASRDAVLDTATEIIGHVVKTFPTIDFHNPTQRLAVGTAEGAFIMYDLKSATQLYVLDGHTHRPTACAFSPDGRRLVTVSLEEGVVRVWKVGASLASALLHPGRPPRQGDMGSKPYKTFPFNVGDEANMTIAGTLEWVRFEWLSDRSVRLRIRESTLSFSA
ncbi:WD40 repeat-like protein [Imleria badia]|nr:WD40 repeat-like protein [Imleria badia]